MVVDSSAWIEFYRDSVTGRQVAKLLPPANECLLPTIVMYEVAKWAARELPERAADLVRTDIGRGVVVVLDNPLAIAAADVSRKSKLAMADAIIYATALEHEAELLTCDSHFEGLPGVHYIAKAGA